MSRRWARFYRSGGLKRRRDSAWLLFLSYGPEACRAADAATRIHVPWAGTMFCSWSLIRNNLPVGIRERAGEPVGGIHPSDTPMPGVDAILLPGEPERISLECRSADGIPLETNLRAKLTELAQRLGVPPLN